MSEQPPNAAPVPAGWYPDAAGALRYWDGHSWGPQAPPPTTPIAPGASTAPPPQVGFSPTATPQKRKPVYKRAWFIVLACLVGLIVIGGVIGAIAGANSQGDASTATCTDLANQAVTISANNTSALQPKILKVEVTRIVTDHRKTFVTPTGTNQALVLSCEGTGVIWSNPDLHANVLLTLQVDKDGQQYVAYKGQ
jgi:Protein of unknown function (DUF2510)